VLPKGAFTHHEHEITFPEHSVNSFVLHCQALLGQGPQPCHQAGEPVGNKCVVLEVIVAVKIAPKSIPVPIQKFIHVGLHQGLIELSLVEVRRDSRAIRHSVAARTRLGGVCCRLSQCSTIFPSSNRKISKPILGTAEVVLRVGEDKIPILENTNCIDFGSALGKRFQALAKSRQAICDAQVGLNIFVGIDGREWAAGSRRRFHANDTQIPMRQMLREKNKEKPC
jgi:hypothetical protein